MGFKLPKQARNYFKYIDELGTNRFKYLFDKYYLCLMLGLDYGMPGKEDEVEKEDFIDRYPEQYVDKGDLILGLLISTEMERKGINVEDRASLEKLMLGLIDINSSTKLSEKGMELLNLYAARGMSIISEKIPKTKELEVFLVHYYKLINSVSKPL